MKWFYDLCKKTDILTSDIEETHRYINYPQMIWNNDLRLKQWLMLRVSGKWEWLKRQSFMTKDKFKED